MTGKKKGKVHSTVDDWVATMKSLTEGVESNLCRSAPERLRSELRAFGTRSTSMLGRAARRQFERDLEAYLESLPSLRAAARRHIRSAAQETLDHLESVLKMMEEMQKMMEKSKATTMRRSLRRYQ